MPRKLSEIKQFVPKSSLNHIQPDPAQNSVMGNVKKLHDALSKANLDKDVEKLMKDHLFKEVCDKLGTNGLMAQAKGDGAMEVESYALAKQDKLEYYNPAAPAPAKNDPQNETENKGPQVGM